MLTYKQLENRYREIHAATIDDVLVPLADARRVANDVYRAHGFKGFSDLLSVDSIEKLDKTRGRTLVGLALMPDTFSGIADVCPHSGLCANSCVAFAGNGGFSTTSRARIAKTELVADHPREFVTLLVHELDLLIKRRGALGVRLNAYSDIRWERMLPANFFARYRTTRFYDYTKHPVASRPELPRNYRLTYSYSERDDAADVAANIAAGRNVAVVVSIRSGKDKTGNYRPIPRELFGRPTVDGDTADDRYADKPGRVVVLRRKHTLAANSPFVVAVH